MPLVDATRTIVGGTITREELERLPLQTRSPLDFVFTLEGRKIVALEIQS